MEKEQIEGYEEIGGSFVFWQPKEDEELEGTLMRKYNGNYGVSYVILSNDVEFIMPNHRILESLLSRVVIGEDVHIIRGKDILPKIAGRKPTKNYRVFVKQ